MREENKKDFADEGFDEFVKRVSTDKDSAEAIKWLSENYQKYGWRFDLFLIKTLYRKIIDILEMFCNAEFWFESPALNHNYVIFLNTIEDLLKKHNELKELQENYVRPFDNLIGSSEDYDIDWNDGGIRRETYRFLGQIEDLFIESGGKFFELPKAIENKLKKIDNFIAEYRKISQGYFQKYLKKATKQLYEQGVWGENVPPHIKKIIDEGAQNKQDRDKEKRQKDAEVRAEEIRKQLEEMNIKQEEKEILKKEIIEEIKKEQQIDERVSKQNGKPYTEIKNSKGYFKFYKQGENIKIGSKDTRHFRLLQCLCEPHFGVQKTIEAIFEAIKLPKDKNDNDLLSYSPQRKTNIITLIGYAKKELQKNKKLQGKIKYQFDDRKNNMWLELEG